MIVLTYKKKKETPLLWLLQSYTKFQQGSADARSIAVSSQPAFASLKCLHRLSFFGQTGPAQPLLFGIGFELGDLFEAFGLTHFVLAQVTLCGKWPHPPVHALFV